jgi:hypothetical protein
MSVIRRSIAAQAAFAAGTSVCCKTSALSDGVPGARAGAATYACAG